MSEWTCSGMKKRNYNYLKCMCIQEIRQVLHLSAPLLIISLSIILLFGVIVIIISIML